jgi:hypothetical protein
MKYSKAKLSIEGMNGVVTIDGWAEDVDSWNGWSYVLMDKENADKLLEKVSDVLEYNEKEDAYVEKFDENQHESEEDLIHWPSFEHEELGKVYSIGSGYWCWTHEFESEFNNMHHALRNFIKAADELVDNWDNEYPTVYKNRKYPSYLPSFDEFVMDMRAMVLHDTSAELHEWRKTIK